MVMSSVEGASVVGITVVSMTVVGTNVVGLAVVTASVVGDIVLDTVSLDISQLTPEKPVKRSRMTEACAQQFKLVNSIRCAIACQQSSTSSSRLKYFYVNKLLQYSAIFSLSPYPMQDNSAFYNVQALSRLYIYNSARLLK